MSDSAPTNSAPPRIIGLSKELLRNVTKRIDSEGIDNTEREDPEREKVDYDGLLNEHREKNPVPGQSALGSSSATPDSSKANMHTSNVEFKRSGTSFFPSDVRDEMQRFPKLPAGNYMVAFNPKMGFYLTQAENFRNPKKLYGDTISQAARIMTTYQAKQGNTGVLLSGLKGSGKTMTAREVSIIGAQLGMPTLLVTSPYVGQHFSEFLSSINQPCIVFIDEFEKVYDEKDQQVMLTLLDGVYQSSKLFLLTCNDQNKVESHFKNRPGRIHYMINFDGLSEKFVREYCEDNLRDKARIPEVVVICSMFESLNFDILQALIWEMNMYNENATNAIQYLNARPGRQAMSYTVRTFDVETKAEVATKNSITVLSNPITSEFVWAVPVSKVTDQAAFDEELRQRMIKELVKATYLEEEEATKMDMAELTKEFLHEWSEGHHSEIVMSVGKKFGAKGGNVAVKCNEHLTRVDTANGRYEYITEHFRFVLTKTAHEKSVFGSEVNALEFGTIAV